ncbi:MAG: MFS transporter [Eubacteriales bacterium]
MNEIKFGKYKIQKDFLIFLIISVLLGIVAAVDSTTLANRLFEDLNFTIMQRSLLETPRELPGLLTVVIIGMLNGLSDIRIAAFANILGGIGLLFFGFVPSLFSFVLITLVIYSTGQHLYMPLASSISMNFAKDGNFGKRIGEIQGLSNLAIIVASALLYMVYRFLHVPYSAVFVIASFCMISAGVLFLFMHQGHAIKSKQRFVFKKEFKLYYGLSLVNGARKQITLTFLPWLIIVTFGQPVTTITLLFFIVCVINVFFKPWLGGFIDKFGERLTLRLEAVFMGLVCIGLAFAKSLFSFQVALIIVSFCYILDNMLISAGMARATYIKKLSKENSEITRTLSMGQSIDHVISMFIPLLAGYIWYINGATGYMYVFLGGIILSISNYILASKIRIPTDENEKY